MTDCRFDQMPPCGVGLWWSGFSRRISAVTDTVVPTMLSIRQGGISDPAFEEIDRLRRAKALGVPRPGPGGLDGAEYSASSRSPAGSLAGDSGP